MNKNRDSNESNLEAVLESAEPDEAERLRAMWDMVGAKSEPFPSRQEIAAERMRLLHALDGASARQAAVGAQERRPHLAAIGRPQSTTRAGRVQRPQGRGLRSSRLIWGAVAAAVALIVAVGWWSMPIEHYAPLGDVVSVTLPDGSTAQLNSGSTLSYGRSFRVLGKRSVDLNGEAFFDVRKHENPFSIVTFDARVTVLGTRFNVRAWPGEREGETTVAVEYGRVALEGEEDRVVVEAGQALRMREGRVAADSLGLSIEDALAWRDGGLIYKNRPLGVVLADVRRQFDVDVRVEPASAETTRIVLARRSPGDAEDVIRDLAAGVENMRYRVLAHGYVLYQTSEE